MPKLFIEESTLTSIGDAIRSKTGKTALIPTLDMPTEIRSISGGSGGGVVLPEEAYIVKGDCTFRFAFNGWNWYLEELGDQVTTRDITYLTQMCYYSGNLVSIPFSINLGALTLGTQPFYYNQMFQGCNSLTTVPRINLPVDMNNYDFAGANNLSFNQIFSDCYNLRNADNLLDAETLAGYISRIRYQSEYNHDLQSMFNSCYSLRTVPSWYYSLKLSPESYQPMQWYLPYNNQFNSCFSLDEATNLIVFGKSTDTWGPESIGSYNGGYTDNMFLDTFNICSRVKNVTFETDNGTPYEVNWANQVIDLSNNLGWGYTSGRIYNSGITTDKQVVDTETYNALKNDPDWWTSGVSFSRYNHDSAVATINSLPDTSDYLATVGGTNTIKFNGGAGELTDGGAINTLTEAEIAVATAKGWTVTLV